MNVLNCLYGALIGLIIVLNAFIGSQFVIKIDQHRTKKEFLKKEIELMQTKIEKEKRNKQ